MIGAFISIKSTFSESSDFLELLILTLFHRSKVSVVTVLL